MASHGKLRIYSIPAIVLALTIVMIIFVSNTSMFAAAKGGLKADAIGTYSSISGIRDPSCTITKGERISNAAMPGYLTSNNIVPISQVQIENGFYDFQSLLEDKLLSGYKQILVPLPFWFTRTSALYPEEPQPSGTSYQSVNLPSMYAVSQSSTNDKMLSYVSGPLRFDYDNQDHPHGFNIVSQALGTVPVVDPGTFLAPHSEKYRLISSPNILDSVQNIKMRDSGVPKVGYGTETVFNDVLFSPMTNDKAVGGQAQFQNIIMRHGGVVQVGSYSELPYESIVTDLAIRPIAGQISQNEEAQFQDNLKNAIIHHGAL